MLCNLIYKSLTQNYILNFGPQHPAAHGVLRLVLELDGERIQFIDPHIGHLHRGTEKLIESKTYTQAIPYFDRLDYVSMLSQEHGFVLAVEKLLNIPITRKAQYIRVLFDELTRLLNHLMCLTTHALDVGALTPFLWGFEEREILLTFYEKISGARMHAAYYRIGGVWLDIPEKLLDLIYKFTFNFNYYLETLWDLLSNNMIWFSRLENVGIIPLKSALDFSFSGPVLRGSGVPWDLRKLQPYETYSELNFSIPTGKTYDCLSRYSVRFFEMIESINIIQQCVSFLSNFKFSDNSFFEFSNKFLNRKNDLKVSMEEVVLYFKHFSKGFNVPAGSTYTVIEAPKGETGVFLVSDNSSKPFRCKIKSPGFLHLQGLNFISKNLLLADLVTNIGSLDIVFGEIDR